MFSARAFVLALALGSADASYDKIAFYSPGSDVVLHNQIDLSAQGMIQFLAGLTIDGDDLDSTVTTPREHFNAASDMYNKGAKSSPYVQYTGSVSSGAIVSADKNAYVCTASDDLATGTNTVILNKAQKGSIKTMTDAVGAVPGVLKVYLNTQALENAVTGCSTVPYQATTADAHKLVNYVAPFTDGACPAIADSTSVTCVATGSTFTFTQGTTSATNAAAKLGGRTLKGFSTGAPGKMGPSGLKEAEYLAAAEFHQSGTYGDDTVQLALSALTKATSAASTFSSCTGTGGTAAGAVKALCGGIFTQGNAICKKTADRTPVIPTGGTFADQKAHCEANGGEVTDFGVREDKLNVEVAKKVAVYANAWLYTIHEFEDAIADCEGGGIADNDASVHAWDEGVAFYTGSLAGTDGIQGGSNGKMIYELANKRCKDYGTCTGASATPDDKTTGESTVNANLFGDFVQGQVKCHFGECAEARTILNSIVPQMTVPLVQGTLRYAYKQDKKNGGEKEIGEGYAFMMAVIHRVHACDPDEAKIIYDAMNLPTTKLGGGHTYADVKQAFENTYECMGITCADVGALLMGDGSVYRDAEQCVDPVPVDEEDSGLPLPVWAIAVIAACGFLAFIFFVMTCYYRGQKNVMQGVYQDMQKNNAKQVAGVN